MMVKIMEWVGAILLVLFALPLGPEFELPSWVAAAFLVMH
jgi:hypothetical protein